MKKIIILVLLFITFNEMHSQSIEFTPLYGFTVNGKIESYNSTFKFNDNMSYGGLLTIKLSDYKAVEFSYKRSDNVVTEFYYPTSAIYKYDIGIEHYQLGFQRIFKKGEFQPFGQFSLGASRYFRKDNRDHITSFSSSLGGGFKYFFSDHIGFRLQSNLIMPLRFGGAGFFCGIGTGGGGCSSGASFYVPIIHWESSVGLIFKLK